jgi:hypothetical protein
MEAGNFTFVPSEMSPAEILLQFIIIFQIKGWLNQTIWIKLGDRKYSLSCSDHAFIVYRINDDWYAPPGVPGWPICIVDPDRVVGSPFAPVEPRALDWLQLIASDDFEPV